MDLELFTRVPSKVREDMFQYIEGDDSSVVQAHDGNWHYVLKEKITTFMFPLVLPFLHEKLASEDILKLRRVCKPWKSAVDVLRPKASPSTTVSRHAHNSETEWFGNNNILGTTFSCPLQIEEFMREMKTTHNGNSPFVNNTVKLLRKSRTWNWSPEKNRMLYQTFTNLIENFGHHIWTCVYSADRSVDCNKEMQYLFEHLPNLKCLVVKRNSYSMSETEEVGLNWLQNPDSLPPMEYLKSLNIFCNSNLLVESLLKRYGSQLSSFQGQLNALKDGSLSTELPIKNESLECLRALKLYGRDWKPDLLERISVFRMPHLECLYLKYSEGGTSISKLETVIRLINKFSSTLVEFRWPFDVFAAPEVSSMKFSSEFQRDICVKLPHVKWLGIPYSYVNFDFWKQFLLKFPNVKDLHIMDFDEDYCSKVLEQEELRQLARRFLMWLPSLQNITVEKDRSNKIIFRSTRQTQEYRKSVSDSSFPRSVSIEDDELNSWWKW